MYLLINIMKVSASRSLHPPQPRAWLRHTPYLRAAQTLKPMCRLKPTRMRTVRRRFCRSNHCFKPCIETSLAALS